MNTDTRTADEVIRDITDDDIVPTEDALKWCAGALYALVRAGTISERDRVTLAGTIRTVGAVLDAANIALGDGTCES